MTSENPHIEAFLRVCEQATLASADYEPDAKPIQQGVCVWELPADMQDSDAKFLRPDFSVLED